MSHSDFQFYSMRFSPQYALHMRKLKDDMIDDKNNGWIKFQQSGPLTFQPYCNWYNGVYLCK